MLAEGWSLEHDPEKWIPGFPKRSCSNKKIDRDDDSKKRHHDLVVGSLVQSYARPCRRLRDSRLHVSRP
jgi:hypothetical protein